MYFTYADKDEYISLFSDSEPNLPSDALLSISNTVCVYLREALL
jgi:hypothetical protein